MGIFRPTAPSIAGNETTNVDLTKIGGNAVTAGAGNVAAGTLRVTLAGDDAVFAKFVGTIANAAPASTVMIGVKAETTFPAAAATDGHTVDPLFDEYGRQWLKGYDPSSNSLMVTDIAPASMQKLGPITFTTLTAAGSTAATNVRPYSNICYQIVVASLESGQFCVVRVEGSHDNSSWYNLDDEEQDKTIDANGTYKMDKSNCCYEYVRFTLVTDSVGGAVTLATKLMAGLS